MRQIKSQHAWAALILIASMMLVAMVTWFLPSLSAVSTNILFRLRGPLGPPDDVVIVAIDDQSLQRIGRWPWPRSVVADALDKISAAQPRAVGLDIVYGEPSVAADDLKLTDALKKNGRVVLPAQLIARESKADERSGAIVWLRPVIGNASTAVGHSHASPDVDGILRTIQLSKADDNGTRLWAFGLEVVRLAEGIPREDFEEKSGTLRFGQYQIPLREQEAAGSSIPGVTVIRPNEMLINYAGPAATFPRYSIASVLDGQVPSSTFAGKIVLIGAVAPAMGDARVSPFMHYGVNDQAGQEMPGVEVHANIINTIRGRLWLRNIPELYGFLISVGIILLTALVIIRLDGWSQVAGLVLIFQAILGGSFFAFKNFLIVPPLPGMLAGFAAAIPLLLNRTLSASRRLDLKLAALARTQKGFLLDDGGASSSDDQRTAWLDLPRDLSWKLRAVDDITMRLLARMNFMDRVLSGMGEGVLVADTSGRVIFANREGAEVFDSSPEKLSLQSFADLFVARGIFDEAELREASSGRILRKEFAVQAAGGRRHYELNLTAISARPTTDDSRAYEPSAAQAIGLVALIADTTRRVELDQTRMETLQLVSHELRTPLTSIQGLSDVLLKFPVETVEAKDMLTTIHAEAVRLSETINRYLDVARLEAGAQLLKKTRISFPELIEDCANRHQPVATERNITIVRVVSPSLPPFAADAKLLTQAVDNLLNNAIKYSPAGSQVSAEVESAGHRILIAVRDQGPGIPEGEGERIFEKFYRLERDAVSEVVGTGLGLSLVKEIAEKHGGLVRVASASGGGSVFTIDLPV